MSAPNRAALLNKTVKVVKKHYHPVAPPADRELLDHLLYACCLENSTFEAADEVFAKLQENYFDWNEVRVTTFAELSEVMAPLTDPAEAAQRLKRVLQSVFEKHYSFSIDDQIKKKQKLGKAISDIEGFAGVTPFVVAYVTQHALGGHAIPVNQGLLAVFVVLGVVSEAEAAKQRIPGLDRMIPKSKGIEYGSLLHQLAVDYMTNPHSTNVRAILMEIAPDAKDRLPKRTAKTSKGQEEMATAAESPTDGEPAKTGRAKKETPAGEAKKSSSKRLTRKKPR